MSEDVVELTPKSLKGRDPILYLRISNAEQAKGDADKPKAKQRTFIDQQKRAEAYLKKNKLRLPKDVHVFREVASGGDSTRPIWKQAIATAAEMGSKAFMIVTELTRFSRDMRYGIANTIPLYENDVPLVAAQDNLIVGTTNAPTPDDDLMMGIKITLGGAERETTRKKEQEGRQARKERGVFPSAGLTLYPDADVDIWQWFIDNVHKAKPVEQGGIGRGVFGRMARAVSGDKVSAGWYAQAERKLKKIQDALTPAQFVAWNEFRKRILALERQENYDGARNIGKPSFRVKAVRYRFNGYLTAPFEKDFYPKPTDAQYAKVYENPRENLSAKDVKLYRQIVGKRGKN